VECEYGRSASHVYSDSLRDVLTDCALIHGKPWITHDLYSHVTRRIVPDFARWSRAEPAVERSVRQRVYDALESPGPHDGGPSPGCRRLRTAWRSGKHGQHADDDGAESRHGRPWRWVASGR